MTEIVKSVDEEFTRTNYRLNAKGFTEAQLLRREKEMELMCKLYPSLNIGHAELIWNYVERTGSEKIQENINNGMYEKKSDKYIKGGSSKGGYIYDKKDPVELTQREYLTEREDDI
jgi:hypothetical protein